MDPLLDLFCSIAFKIPAASPMEKSLYLIDMFVLSSAQTDLLRLQGTGCPI